MAFIDAVYDGASKLDGLEARLVAASVLRAAVDSRSYVPIVVDAPVETIVADLKAAVLVNARMRKREDPDPQIGLAPLTIGLGPGFRARTTTDVVIETSWEDLGRIIHEGSALPLRGEPRSLAGHGRDRFVYSPVSGLWRTGNSIGDLVEADDVIAHVGESEIRAPLSGVLRALTRTNVQVAVGDKVVELDPREESGVTDGIGERPGRLAESVLTVIRQWEDERGENSTDHKRRSRRLISAAFGFPIAILGGLIGLGGAEFRLPVLVGPLKFQAKRAVPLNLLISLSTIASALAIRSATMSFAKVMDFSTELLALTSAAVIAAFFAVTLVRRLSEGGLQRVLLILLLTIGGLLLAEGISNAGQHRLAPENVALTIAIGLALGAGIGVVSTMLGVAGGELIIPSFLFVFGADVRTAGTASLLVSLPTVTVGIVRHARARAYQRQDILDVAIPMAAASVVGAVVGGLAAGVVPARWLKIVLGVILIASALKVLHRRSQKTTT